MISSWKCRSYTDMDGKATGSTTRSLRSTFSMQSIRYAIIQVNEPITHISKTAVVFFIVTYAYFSPTARPDGYGVAQYEFATVSITSSRLTHEH